MWLKSLRLHKYSHIFLDITYEGMLNLSEDYLEQKGVTKGARNKIIISIQKIKERKTTLFSLEKVMEKPVSYWKWKIGFSCFVQGYKWLESISIEVNLSKSFSRELSILLKNDVQKYNGFYSSHNQNKLSICHF